VAHLKNEMAFLKHFFQTLAAFKDENVNTILAKLCEKFSNMEVLYIMVGNGK